MKGKIVCQTVLSYRPYLISVLLPFCSFNVFFFFYPQFIKYISQHYRQMSLIREQNISFGTKKFNVSTSIQFSDCRRYQNLIYLDYYSHIPYIHHHHLKF